MNIIDSDRLRELFDAHGARLILFARQWCTLPDDAVQEAFIALAHQIPEPDEPVSWLFRAVKFQAINIARSEGRREKHHRRVSQERESWFQLPSPIPIDTCELEKQLSELKLVEREVLVARIWGDLSFEAIAELVGCSVSTAHRTYRRALAKLEEAFSDEVGR
ncbi:MAG: RNA polymerase sigma factor [Planctomycetales bacterium]|nr:RNA polymerase sigma factor [Planctomycetales bacterium]